MGLSQSTNVDENSANTLWQKIDEEGNGPKKLCASASTNKRDLEYLIGKLQS